MIEDITSKHLVRLYRGDYDTLARLRPDSKPNTVIRELVRQYIASLQEELGHVQSNGR
jgi:hypothetical protein